MFKLRLSDVCNSFQLVSHAVEFHSQTSNATTISYSIINSSTGKFCIGLTNCLRHAKRWSANTRARWLHWWLVQYINICWVGRLAHNPLEQGWRRYKHLCPSLFFLAALQPNLPYFLWLEEAILCLFPSLGKNWLREAMRYAIFFQSCNPSDIVDSS